MLSFSTGSRPVVWLVLGSILVAAQGQPARAQTNRFQAANSAPGDTMIRAWLEKQALALDARFAADASSRDAWNQARPRFQAEYLDMLGLRPLPARTPLRATVTGTITGEGYIVENLHYQSVPGLYVTGNLYRPAKVEPGTRVPAVFYVCGHSGMGRDGNKTAFQSHGIWFARHGYICLVVDTLQLGEIAGIHHGTYREGRWWWHARGYTSAGVECWNGVRGIDYLTSRPDVDPRRIAVTGISGGGAATFWIAAADERVAVAVPVSGMADLESYVGHRVVNGHCDCMFLYNTYRWPWTRIAGLIAPRPLLFVNSDNDAIFPMDANERVSARLERLYSQFGASDQVDAVVSVGGHAYRKDIRQAVYRFINTHLKNDPTPISDSEFDVVPESGSARSFAIEPKRLRVFATDADIPADARNGRIDETFVPVARVELPAAGAFDGWKSSLIAALRERTLRDLPDRVPAARPAPGGQAATHVETEPGITLPLTRATIPDPSNSARSVLLIVSGDESGPTLAALGLDDTPNQVVYRLQPRGIGATRWTSTNPPNTVERSLALLGCTADSGRIRDVAATARLLRDRHGPDATVVVAGSRDLGVLAAYAALIEPAIDEVVAVAPPESHASPGAPRIVGVLRVLDIPDALGLLAPRRLTLRNAPTTLTNRVASIYSAAKATDRLKVKSP